MTRVIAARGQRPMATKRGWRGSERRSPRARKTGPKTNLTTEVTTWKFNREKKYSHTEWCAHVRQSFRSRKQRREARYRELGRGLKNPRRYPTFIRGPVEDITVVGGTLVIPQGWAGTGSPSSHVYDMTVALRESWPARISKGFVDFFSRLFTGKCLTCGNHESYGLFFGCAHFMENQRARLQEYVREYLLVFAESNQDEEEALHYVRIQLEACFNADCRLEEALRAYWWSWIWWPLWSQVGWLVREFQVCWDVVRFSYALAGRGLLPKPSKRAVEKNAIVTRHRQVLSFIGWLLSHAELSWETVDGVRLPVVDFQFHRQVDLMSKIYLISRVQVIGRILTYVSSGHDMPIKSKLFRDDVHFISLSDLDDSTCWGDWSRGEARGIQVLTLWLVRALATGETGWVRTAHFFRAIRIAAGLKPHTELSFVVLETGGMYTNPLAQSIGRRNFQTLGYTFIRQSGDCFSVKAFQALADQKMSTVGVKIGSVLVGETSNLFAGFFSSWQVEIGSIAAELESKRLKCLQAIRRPLPKPIMIVPGTPPELVRQWYNVPVSVADHEMLEWVYFNSIQVAVAEAELELASVEKSMRVLTYVNASVFN